MTPEERQLLTALGDRLRDSPQQQRDIEADMYIQGLLRERPDAAYLLAQTVIMQDFAMRNASAQLADLQRQLEEARRNAQPQQGSFLGSIFGGARTTPQPGPWSQSAYQPVYGAPVMQPAQTSGFLRSAAETAVGVAGGALLFEGIQSLFSGHHGYGGWEPAWGSGYVPQGGLSETTIVNNYYDEPRGGADPGNYAGSRDFDPAADVASDMDFTPDNSGGGDFSGDDSF